MNGPNKAELRLQMKARLAAAIQDRRAHREKSLNICEALRSHPAWPTAQVVGAFLPLRSEPDLRTLWEAPERPIFCFPRLRMDRLEFIRVDDEAALRRADWRFALPEFEAAPALSIAEIDLLLVPGLAFTRTGARLGRGGGHYDRWLARRPARTVAVGVCFDLQVVEDLPCEAHDCRVQAIATESGLLSLK